MARLAVGCIFIALLILLSAVAIIIFKIKFRRCPHCRELLMIGGNDLGVDLECPGCGHTISVSNDYALKEKERCIFNQ